MTNLVINKILPILVEDMIEFQQSKLGQELKEMRAPPYMWKYITLTTHGRAGFTTAALDLMEQYVPTVIIVPNYKMRDQIICENNKPRDDEHIMVESSLTDNWLAVNTRPEMRRRLIIIDNAGMIQYQRTYNGMDLLRDRLFMVCDILVELQ